MIDRGQRPNYSFIREMVADNLAGKGPKVRIMMDREGRQILNLSGYNFLINPQFHLDSLYHVFFEQWFPEKDLSGYEVIDIGAYTGDTAIYFASKGAKVHAYEPVPEVYAMMQRNIELSGLQNAILTYRCAISETQTSTMWVDTRTYEGSSLLADAEDTLRTRAKIQVQSATIRDALAKCGLQSKKLLKMNCEGCEFTIITESNGELLKNFHTILCFYHPHLTGIPKETLIKVLQESGFEVDVKDSQLLLIACKPEEHVIARQ